MAHGIQRLASALLAITLLAGLSACKIRLNVPEDTPGGISVLSGNFYCQRLANGVIEAGSNCNLDVVDIFFDETFVALPAEGYSFAGWKKDHRHFCGGSRKPCRLATSGFEGNDKLTAILEDDQQVFFLEPVFTPGEEALAGNYKGEWRNNRFETSGGISLRIVDNGDDTFDFTLDLDGNVFGQGDPGPVTITAEVLSNGNIGTAGTLTIGGQPASYEFVIDTDSNLLFLSLPNLPVDGIRFFEVLGPLYGGSGLLETLIRFDDGTDAFGTATLYKP